MASITLGRIEEFDSSQEEWPWYVERLKHFFAANSIAEDEKKCSVFLTVICAVICAATYKVLRDLVAPAKPGTKPLEELLQKLEQHYSPRKPGEAIAAFIARLHSLSEHCTFGDSL